MSVKVIAQLNPFSTEKTVYNFESQPVSEIIKKIDKNEATNTGWRVLFDDEIITDFSRIPDENTTVLLKLVPTGDNQDVGVGMKIGGGLLAAAGVIVGIATSWTGIGLGIGSALIGAGVGMLTGGIALYNIDIPSLKDRPSPEQDSSIRGSQNQLRPRGYIPVLLGKRRFYADLAMTSYTWVDSATGSMYLYQLFCAGQKDIVIDESTLKIDETLLSSYQSGNNIEYEISYGEDTPPFFEKCVHEDQVMAILKHYTEDEADASIIKTTPECTEINVDIFFHNGLAKYNDDGELVNTTVNVEAYYKQSDEPDSAYQLLGNFTESGNEITGNELKTKRYAITKSGLTSASYTVKITRVTEDSTNSKVIDDVYVGSIRSIKNEMPISARRCRQLTLFALKIKATEKLNNVVQQLNFISQSKMPVWDGVHSGPAGWTNSILTSNPASAAIYAMQAEIAQQKLSANEIDWPSFEKLYNWCNTHGYECNIYITESMSISQLLTAIGSTCRTEILRMNGKITALMDIERSSAVQLFTPRNSYDYSETIISADVPDALNIGFADKDSGYADNELYVYNTPSGNYEEEPETIQDVTLWGVTSSEQARKLGMWKYAVSNNRPFVHSWFCDVEYLMCQKGDWVKYAGDIALIGTTQCRVTECIYQNNQCIGIKVDEVIHMTAGTNVVRYRKNDGALVLLNIKYSAKDTNELLFTTAPFENLPEPDNLVAVGLQDYDTIDLIVTDIKCDNNLSAEITAVEYSPEVFGVDSPDFILPAFQNKISDIPATVDNGITSTDNWKLFFTYHDGDTEPSVPTGNGTTNGWHNTQTSESIWISSKTAKDIGSGQWSRPRTIRGPRGEKGEPGSQGAQGIPGPSTVVYEIKTSSAVIVKYFDGSYNVPNIDINIKKYEGTVFDSFNGRIEIKEIDEQGRGTIVYQSESSESFYRYTPSGNLKSINIKLYNFTTGALLDEENIGIASSADGFTVFGDNDVIIAHANAVGSINSPLIQECQIYAYQGESECPFYFSPDIIRIYPGLHLETSSTGKITITIEQGSNLQTSTKILIPVMIDIDNGVSVIGLNGIALGLNGVVVGGKNTEKAIMITVPILVSKSLAAVGVATITEYYARSETQSIPALSSFIANTVPNFTGKNKYLWNYTVTQKNDGTLITTEPQIISFSAKEIQSVSEKYQISSSSTTVPTTWVNDTPPAATETNPYLWNYEITTYTDGSTHETTPHVIYRLSKDGAPGTPGDPGTPAPRKLGVYSSNPSTRPDGTSLVSGDTYINNSNGYLYEYGSGTWTAITDSNDTRYFEYLGDMMKDIETNPSTTKFMAIGTAWIKTLCAGTVLAQQIKATEGFFNKIKMIIDSSDNTGIFSDDYNLNNGTGFGIEKAGQFIGISSNLLRANQISPFGRNSNELRLAARYIHINKYLARVNFPDLYGNKYSRSILDFYKALCQHDGNNYEPMASYFSCDTYITLVQISEIHYSSVIPAVSENGNYYYLCFYSPKGILTICCNKNNTSSWYKTESAIGSDAPTLSNAVLIFQGILY